MELLRARGCCLLACSCSLLLSKLGHLLLVERRLRCSQLPCHYLRSLWLLGRIGSLLLGLLHHVESSCLPHSGLIHLSLRCSLKVRPGLSSEVLLRSQLLLLRGASLLHKLGLWVHRLRSLLGHGCLLLELLLLLLSCDCLCCRCNCVYLLLLLGSGCSVHAYNSLLVRRCLLKANPLGILLNGRSSNHLPGPIVLHGGLLCLLLSWLLL